MPEISRFFGIFGEQSLKLKVAHAKDVDVDRRLVEAFTHRRFDRAECKDKLDRLTRLRVPAERFLAGMLEVLAVKPPAAPPRSAAHRDGWSRLAPWLRGLGDKYRRDLDATAYALVNAASEYASDSSAPLMNPARVEALGGPGDEREMSRSRGSWPAAPADRKATPPRPEESPAGSRAGLDRNGMMRRKGDTACPSSVSACCSSSFWA